MPRRVRSLEAAAAWVDDAGLAVVYSSADLVLPSLWEAVGGPDADWAIRDEQGKAVDFTPEFSKLWRWKDELAEKKLACSGRHLGRDAASLVSRRMLAPLYALTGRPGRAEDFRELELDPLERETAEAILENGPCSGPEVRRLVPGEKRKVDTAVKRLQRALVLTNAGIVEQEAGWPAIRNDLFARRWSRELRRLPAPDDARRALAMQALRTAGEISAADLAAVLRWRRSEAVSTLEELTNLGHAHEREEDGIQLWRA
ncbi:MAG TPA: crosslink repair DNA glycosylase YcaQ family protein [Gaiellaceae bacterium]|nr:crosslink repair DNA glycosylase YcaQ family protein [Gaiellaceae bacterium]